MRRFVPFAAIATFLTVLQASMGATFAQTIPKSLQEGGTENALKARKNTWTVGVAGGLLEGTYMRFADELAKVLNDGDNLRVLPIVSYGAAANLEDLLYLRGVDVAVTQSDVFEFFRTERKTPNLENRVHYIIRLPVSEMHVLARADIRSIEDLRGKKVNLGPPGSATSLTGSIIFQRLGINIEQTALDNPVAMQKMKAGEIAALVRVVGKPVDFFAKMPPNSGFHFLSIPFTKKFADYYTLGEFTNGDYPGLVGKDERIDTIAVPAVLAAYNWQKGGDRYRRVERFVERLFENWSSFQQPPRHPKWRDVNLSATVPGWSRFAVAERMLTQIGGGEGAEAKELSRDFQAFLARSGDANAARSDAERDALFRQFLQWRERQSTRRN
ncbi:MAG: C4-dicarboxylate ABC transporter [Proteobacteria bacterium]|nr:C4-dicarboxylate ABC transporter [Pseudomonadota bacterium]